MSGVSHGGIQTLLAAEAGGGMRAYVPFAPAAIGWSGNPELHERLRRAVRRAGAPIFLLQAENDHSLGPSEVLGAELRRKGGRNRARVYPAYGESPETGHGEFACRGTDAWGADVRAFLDEALGAPSAAAA
jgi:pimeloyl-ACP methyl ester carboxylesterase